MKRFHAHVRRIPVDHEGPFNVLFLCTGNSARSIMGEVIINKIGRGKFKGYSAGSHPSGRVHPFVLELLQAYKLPIEGLRSKSWSEFARSGAPFMHVVITVCDRASAESCPIWPGQPMTAHWGIQDPVAAQGSEDMRRKAFETAFTELQRKIFLFIDLPMEKLSDLSLKESLDRIGRLP